MLLALNVEFLRRVVDENLVVVGFEWCGGNDFGQPRRVAGYTIARPRHRNGPSEVSFDSARPPSDELSTLGLSLGVIRELQAIFF